MKYQSPIAECDHAMMDSLRAAANSLVLKIIFGIVIVSFTLSSVSNYLTNNDSKYAAKVNGQEIGYRQFENIFDKEKNRVQKQLGTQFSELATNRSYMAFLRQQTLNRLINETLLDQYAKKLGLRISDEQVKNAIFATHIFQINGHFNNARYNAIINQTGMSADQYAQALRNQLTTQQLINAVFGTDFMLKGEADRLVDLVTQQRIVRKATLNVNAMAAKQPASADEVKAYYEQNKTSFMVPEQFRVIYLKLDASALPGTADDSEILSYYNQHRFIQAQRNRYRVIQTKTEADAKAVLEELNNGADFAAVAKTKSTDIISAKNGGDVGWLEEAATPEELKNAALKERGQVSGIIKSSVGFLVVKLDDLQPEKIRPLTEVRDDIAAKIKKEKTLKAYYALQQKVANAARNFNESLAGAEQAAGLKAVKTGWFGRDNLPQELNFKPVSDAIFNGALLDENGKPGSNSDVITVDDNHAFVLRVAEHKPETVKPLDVVKDQVAAVVKHKKAEQQAKVDAEKFLVVLKGGKEDKTLKTVFPSFGPEKTLSRTNEDPISQTAFTLKLPTKDRPSYGIASDMQGNIVLLALNEVKAATMPETQKKEMMQAIAQNNTQIAFEALISNLRKEAKIKLNDTITQL